MGEIKERITARCEFINKQPMIVFNSLNIILKEMYKIMQKLDRTTMVTEIV